MTKSAKVRTLTGPIFTICPRCFAVTADFKAHQRWHKRSKAKTGPMGPPGPMGPMGPQGMSGHWVEGMRGVDGRDLDAGDHRLVPGVGVSVEGQR